MCSFSNLLNPKWWYESTSIHLCGCIPFQNIISSHRLFAAIIEKENNIMSTIQNITVPYVPLSEFDWSFARSGPLPWNQTVW